MSNMRRCEFITLLGGVAARYRILADEGVLNMPMAVYVTVLAIVFGFAVPASAEDRPSDPIRKPHDRAE